MNTKVVSRELEELVAKNISHDEIAEILDPPIIEEKKELSYEEAYMAAISGM